MKIGDVVIFNASKMDNSFYNNVKEYSKGLIDGNKYIVRSIKDNFIEVKGDNWSHPVDIFEEYAKYDDNINIIEQDYVYLEDLFKKLNIN